MTLVAASPSRIDRDGLGLLVDSLRARGYHVIGPTVRDDAIVLAELESAAELPWGVGVTLEAGAYRLRQRDDDAAFGHVAGPQSWKRFLHPPRHTLWSAKKYEGFVPEEPIEERPRYAFLGVRPCDLRAIRVLDRVLLGGTYSDASYEGRRQDLFMVAIDCTEAGATCFCTSMGSGPAADSGFDLALTELADDGDHRFVVAVGSELGAQVLADVPTRPAEPASIELARSAVSDAAASLGTSTGRAMPEGDLRQVLVASRESSRWNDIATRCLSCGNCTLVCPTCFCTTTEDVTDLSGERVERVARWDSCFDLSFSYVHGDGPVRTSTQSRYRQWITHKLSTWHDQFDSSGCVGCGRCIVWCPVGIDITEEAHALATEVTTARGAEPASAP